MSAGPLAAAEPFALTIEVPGAPVAKARPRAFSRGGKIATYTPGKTRSYEQLVKLQAADAMQGAPPFEGEVSLIVSVFLPVPASWPKKKQAAALEGTVRPAKRPDIDNYVKSAMDALNEVAFRDDSQVVSLVASKHYSERPRLIVEVMAL